MAVKGKIPVRGANLKPIVLCVASCHWQPRLRYQHELLLVTKAERNIM